MPIIKVYSASVHINVIVSNILANNISGVTPGPEMSMIVMASHFCQQTWLF